jgi:uncharacterized damage-inducible protein DinB
MKELLLQYAEYNVWANNKMIEAFLKPEPGFVDHEIISSFPSIRATLYHTWSAEYIWLQRLLLVEKPVWQASDFKGTFEEACNAWKSVSGGLVEFTGQCNDKALTNEVLYHDRAGVSYKTPVYQVLHHVFNHSTYHRGQLVTMLRQLALKEIPATDFIAFVRKK